MGKRVYAYRIEYKMMTTMLLSWSSCVLATSLTATHSCSPVESFVVLGLWVCGLVATTYIVYC